MYHLYDRNQYRRKQEVYQERRSKQVNEPANFGSSCQHLVQMAQCSLRVCSKAGVPPQEAGPGDIQYRPPTLLPNGVGAWPLHILRQLDRSHELKDTCSLEGKL